MGNRTAKLEGEDIWIVYQSVTDAVFSPMFRDELSAELYAFHWYQVGLTSPEWGKEHTVGDEVMGFIRALYGEEPQENRIYWQVLADVQSGRTRDRTIKNLWLVFAEWRKDQSKKPEFVLTEED